MLIMTLITSVDPPESIFYLQLIMGYSQTFMNFGAYGGNDIFDIVKPS